jgi:hypothetical protein
MSTRRRKYCIAQKLQFEVRDPLVPLEASRRDAAGRHLLNSLAQDRGLLPMIVN